MSNKTISINPGLFSIGNKTKKNKEKKQKPNVPLISPNVLKHKLLARIKQHKQHETENLANNKKKLREETNLESGLSDPKTFPDEFSDSINYLQTLSKQKKINDEKVNYEKQKQRRKEVIERKTIKNHQSLSLNTQPYVNLDLPEELQINTEQFVQPFAQSIQIKQKEDVPYGVLKGGSKPTYRDWTRTQRNNIVTDSNNALIIQGDDINKEKSKRETHLENLRNKLKLKQLEESKSRNEDIMMTQNLIQKPSQIISDDIFKEEHTIINNTNTNSNNNPLQTISTTPLHLVGGNQEKIIGVKKITKKTIKRKYTLGKSKVKRTISVLVKDRGTRKKILNAQKELSKSVVGHQMMY